MASDFETYHVHAAQRYNFREAETLITYLTLAWFNAWSFKIGGHSINIGTDYEPTLRQLCQTKLSWNDELADAHDRLIKRGVFKDDVYIAGRRCRWTPTQEFFRVADNVFSDAEEIYPQWIEQEHTGPPAFRDGQELLEHRKGVMALDRSFDRIEQISYTDVYPRHLDIAERPDIRIWGHGSPAAWGEILGTHNNRETWSRKYRAWAENSLPKVWIFPNRQTMVQFWNHLLRRELIELDNGMFTGPASNWSPTRVNDRLQRSRTGRYSYNSHDCCWTVAGLIEADTVDVLNWLSEYDII